MQRRPKTLVFLPLALALPCCAGKDISRDGPVVRIGDREWTVETARTARQRYDGLSGRSNIPPDRGLLFIYPAPRIIRLCMRDCAYPLDAVFIGADMRVVSAAAMTVEPDRAGRRVYTSERPAVYALEVRGGTVAAAGIARGDSVRFDGVDTRASE